MNKKNKKKRLVLLDAHAILHRAYHALPDFSSSSGEATGALYGLSTMLLKIIDDLKPDYLVACFDVAEPTYRHEAYEEYKAGRAKTEEELVAQIKRSYDVFRAFGIPVYEKAGFEADDVIGTIVEEMKDEKDIEIVIASGDLDTLQLVSGKKVTVYTLRKGIKDTIVYDEKAVKERFNFPPTLLPDYKGLRGDPSDNIIGVKGVGEKTATSLITAYGTVEEIYKALKKDEEKFMEKAGVTKRIAGILKDNEEEALFSKMLAEIRRDAPIEFKIPDQTWEEGLDIEKVLELFSELSFRTLGTRVKKLFGVEEVEEEKKQEDVDEEEVKKVGIALWLLDSTVSKPTLDDIYAHTKKSSWKEAKKQIMDEIKKRDLEKVYKEIELPLIPVVEKMEERGVLLDLPYLKKLSKEYRKELGKLEEKIWGFAGEEFNINSPKQLGEVIYEKLELGSSKVKKTSTGAKSTRESELQKIRDEHEIIDLILEYREFQKLLSTYIDTLPAQVADDGRLHAEFLQTGTTTGRLSSQNPNLQNIPIKTERGKLIRKGFVATKGFEFLDFDYSQIELRVAAMLSGDEKLLDIFRGGRDVHTEVASEVFEVPPEKVDKEMRRRAKVINFGILYGMGVNALRVNLGTDRKEAQKFLNEYFKKFSTLAEYIEKTKVEASVKGYVETYFGRKRFLDGLKSNLPYIRAEAERQAVNAPLQGTQADIIKLAMIKIDNWIEKEKLNKDIYLLLQVHDELLFEVKKDKVNEAYKNIKKIMESIVSPEEASGIKFIADAERGPNWGGLKKF